MTDRILTTPTQSTVTCARLGILESELGRSEMKYTSGGLVFPQYDRLGHYVNFAIRLVAEVIRYAARPR